MGGIRAIILSMLSIMGSRTYLSLSYNKHICAAMKWSLFMSSQSQSIRPIISSEFNDKIKIVKSLKLKKKRDSLGLVLFEGFR